MNSRRPCIYIGRGGHTKDFMSVCTRYYTCYGLLYIYIFDATYLYNQVTRVLYHAHHSFTLLQAAAYYDDMDVHV